MSDLTLPPELLDHIVDLLHDDRRSLKNCCLVSKSWIPRARKNLFANVEFHNHMHLFSWKNTFPDPSASPAYYTQTLIINFYPVVMAADAEQGGWIPTFSRVAHFEIRTSPFEPVNYNLVPLHGFAPALKSLHVAFLGLPSSNTFNFIYSFPLLEDLRLETDMLYSGNVGENPPVTQLSSPPPFTGTLKLSLNTGTIPAISQLLSLPGGLHFRELHLTFFCQRDILSMEALVERCSSTLKILKIGSKLFGTPNWHLYSCRRLTVAHSHSIATATLSHQPLEGDKARKCSVHMPTKSTTGCEHTPNHHTQSQKPPVDLILLRKQSSGHLP